MEYTAGEKLKVIMKRKGMTITDLAKKLGKSRQNMSNKFARDNFNENDLKAISEALNVDYIIEFKDRE